MWNPKSENFFKSSLSSAFLADAVPGAAEPSSPLLTSRLTSGFGQRLHPILGGMRRHLGVDLAAPAGSPIFATYSGKVTNAGWARGYGCPPPLIATATCKPGSAICPG
jgi:murein DD-endopeptidase MepM/ murein hydrolase activator NlpD